MDCVPFDSRDCAIELRHYAVDSDSVSVQSFRLDTKRTVVLYWGWVEGEFRCNIFLLDGNNTFSPMVVGADIEFEHWLTAEFGILVPDNFLCPDRKEQTDLEDRISDDLSVTSFEQASEPSIHDEYYSLWRENVLCASNHSGLSHSSWQLQVLERDQVVSIWTQQHPDAAIAANLRGVKVIDESVFLVGEWLSASTSHPVVAIFHGEGKYFDLTKLCSEALSGFPGVTISEPLAHSCGFSIHDVDFDSRTEIAYLAAEYFFPGGFLAVLFSWNPKGSMTILSTKFGSHAAAYTAVLIDGDHLIFAGRTHDGERYTLFADQIFLKETATSSPIVRPLFVQTLPPEQTGDVEGLLRCGNEILVLASESGHL